MSHLKFIATLAFTTSLLSCTGAHNKWSSAPVVKVDSVELLATDFSQRLALKLKSFDALTVKDTNVISRARSEVVDEFIIEALSLKWAQEQGLQLKSSLIKEEVMKVKKAYPDELSFKMALAEEGLTLSLWLKNFRNTLLQKYVFEKVTENLETPSEEELKEYYKNNPGEFRTVDKVKIRQIVLESENNAQRLVNELKKGRKLSELAKKYSITPEADNEGLLGWVEAGTNKVFDEALKQGRGLSYKLHQSNFGFHIIEILDIKKGKQLNFKDVKDSVANKVLAQKKQKAFSQWLESQLRSSHIYKNEDLIQAIYAETKG
ncbi:MAG: peptidylprolyl isomerase [Bdellovibrionales bacterium]|nr:peptidylprolyl isomerase [Bdellovibrionales bacterium]